MPTACMHIHMLTHTRLTHVYTHTALHTVHQAECGMTFLLLEHMFSILDKHIVCVCAVAQACPTLCDPMDCSLPGSSDREIFQARILEWVAISFSSGSFQPVFQYCVSPHTGEAYSSFIPQTLTVKKDILPQVTINISQAQSD